MDLRIKKKKKKPLIGPPRVGTMVVMWQPGPQEAFGLGFDSQPRAISPCLGPVHTGFVMALIEPC